jgi:hypothetical protein
MSLEEEKPFGCFSSSSVNRSVFSFGSPQLSLQNTFKWFIGIGLVTHKLVKHLEMLRKSQSFSHRLKSCRKGKSIYNNWISEKLKTINLVS